MASRILVHFFILFGACYTMGVIFLHYAVPHGTHRERVSKSRSVCTGAQLHTYQDKFYTYMWRIALQGSGSEANYSSGVGVDGRSSKQLEWIQKLSSVRPSRMQTERWSLLWFAGSSWRECCVGFHVCFLNSTTVSVLQNRSLIVSWEGSGGNSALR